MSKYLGTPLALIWVFFLFMGAIAVSNNVVAPFLDSATMDGSSGAPSCNYTQCYVVGD